MIRDETIPVQPDEAVRGGVLHHRTLVVSNID
jgi:hypothetical protein